MELKSQFKLRSLHKRKPPPFEIAFIEIVNTTKVQKLHVLQSVYPEGVALVCQSPNKI